MKISELGNIVLQQQHNHQVQKIEIDCSEWLKEYPNANISLVVKRPNESTLYIPDTILNGDILTWNITDYDTYKAGFGSFQIVLNNELGENIRYSKIYSTRVFASQEGTAQVNPPAPTPSWITEILNTKAEHFYINEQGHTKAIGKKVWKSILLIKQYQYRLSLIIAKF